MTAGGAVNDSRLEPKSGENNGGITNKSNLLFANNEGFNILLQQAIYEINRGSHRVALEYLNKAVKVRKNS